MLSVVTLVFIFVAAIPFSIGYQTGSRSYILARVLIGFLLVGLLSYPILDINRRITTDSSGIIVKKPFSTVSITWPEIVEFRAHETGIGEGRGGDTT